MKDIGFKRLTMGIKRRQVLQTIGTSIAAGAFPTWAIGSHDGPRIGIVGGGIVGASIAYHLSRMGAQVTLFEKTRPAAGATQNSFAWINTISPDEHYATLRMQSIFAWRTLDQQLPLNVTWGGMVMWSDVGNAVQAGIQELIGLSFDQSAYPKHVVDAQQLAAIVPNLAIPGNLTSALHIPLDGHVDPVYCTELLIAGARQYGANVLYPYQVEDLEFEGARLTAANTDRGRFELDKIVLAGGTDTPILTEKLGYEMPLLHRPGIFAHSKPIEAFTNVVALNTSGLTVKQFPDGRIVASDADAPPELDVHTEIRRQRAEMPEAIAQEHGARILTKVGQAFPAAEGAEFDKLTLGYRPYPSDGMPIVGRLDTAPDVYVATMHSGVTLAPIIGQYVTRELLSDLPVPMLEPYRPSRF